MLQQACRGGGVSVGKASAARECSTGTGRGAKRTSQTLAALFLQGHMNASPNHLRATVKWAAGSAGPPHVRAGLAYLVLILLHVIIRRRSSTNQGIILFSNEPGVVHQRLSPWHVPALEVWYWRMRILNHIRKSDTHFVSHQGIVFRPGK